MSIQSEIERINNNVQATLSTIAETGVEVGENSDALPAAAAALANEKVSVNQGTNHAGKLLYVNASGAVTPLTLGDGLTIADGVIQAAGGGGGEVLSIEEIRAICGYQSDFDKNYTPVEYIESTGTQYIDTGFQPNQDTRVVLNYGGVNESGWREVLGAGASVTNPSNNFVLVQSSSNGVMMQYGSAYHTAGVTSDGSTLDINKNNFYVNGSLVKAFTYATFTCPYTLRLFDAATKAEDYSRYSGKLYSCQIYDNGTLVRDYVPCYRNSDGIVGLYDKVNEQFYGNAGTGSFAYGTGLLPDGYAQVQYIESSGTQYIDTGFVPNSNTRILMDCEVLNFGTACYYGVSSVSSGSSTHSQTNIFLLISGTSLRCDWYGSMVSYSGVATGRHTLDKNKNVALINGVSVITNTDTVGSCLYSAYLFARNVANNSVDLYSEMRLYSCQIYDNGTLVRDYIPCMNDQGVYGLYDTVGAQFYTNAGSGSFTGA